ncbi:hypothetical protein HPB48_003843 [Haemaphysalis longicornis]|uniref:Uncharacterized protein n=1 Tax=Haemaphysalis longicornis TaxID=44386 RepID=A0A9J6FBF2_HAELO|nr:hypothetical protein HPB48_003843 [Haemaphysalis longicornis]
MAPGATGPPDVTAGRTPPQTAPLASSSCNMDVVEVEEPKRKQAIRLPRQPRLPKEDIKIVLRPRDGLDVAKLNDAQIRDGVLSAAAIKKEEAEDDLLQTSPKQNIIVVSTPNMARAEKYNKIRQLCFGEHSYEITAYAAPPGGHYQGSDP